MRLSGSITALATPFTAAGEIDLAAWRRLLQAQLEGGTRALVVAGSTGEAPALVEAERDLLIRSAVESMTGRIPVLAGTGTSSTAGTIEQTRRAAALGADAALVVTPPYVRPTQAGLVAHFFAVADDGELPIVLYNVPARSGCDLLPEAVSELSRHERIVGIKEAVGDPARMQALLALRGEGFAVLGGDDATAARAMLAGADGVVSVASNVAPNALRMLCVLALAGRRDEADALNERLAGLFAFLGLESNPIPLKSLLQQLGIGQGLRLPLTPLSSMHGLSVARTINEIIELERSTRELAAA